MSIADTTTSSAPLHAWHNANADNNIRQRWSRRVAADIVALVDALAVVLGALLPAYICAQTAGVTPHWPSILQVALITAIITCACLRTWHAYDTSRMHDFPLVIHHLLASLVISMVAVLGLGLPFTPDNVMLWIWYSVWLSCSFTLLLGTRAIVRAVLANLTAAGRFDTRIAVYGAGTTARRVHDYLASRTTGIRLVGVFDDRAASGRVDSDGLNVAGALTDLIEAGRNGEVDQIVIALPPSADDRMAKIVRQLDQLPISVHIVTHMASDLVETVLTHKVSAIGPVGMLDVKKSPLADWAPIIKHGTDYVLGALLAVITLPLCLLIAVAIRLENSGPIFFIQRRHGLNKRIINVYKFRTMHVMEDGKQVRQATRQDERITHLGSFLRRTSLDELPQFWNVLKGEMSLIGPRPHALVHDEQWGEMLEQYANRHQVKPGITGLAQVSGLRGKMDTPEKIKARVDHDLEYIQNWSFWLDIKILIRTIGAVLFAKNAY